MTYVWGALGAAAPEIVRWYRLSKEGPILEWRRRDYWFATVLYVMLGGLMASLVAQPNPYAAFLTGITTELAILGALDSASRDNVDDFPNGMPEETVSISSSRLHGVLDIARSHATFLRVR